MFFKYPESWLKNCRNFVNPARKLSINALVAFGILVTFCLITVTSAQPNEIIEVQETTLIKNNNDLPLSEPTENLEIEIVETTNTEKDTVKLSDKEPSKPSPLTMDLLSLIWYLTTLLALIGFFVVMACTENTCGRRSGQKPEDLRSRPPTPAPSYRNFAPPSYDSVMKKYKSRIYIVPVHENNDFFHQNLAVDSSNSENSIKDVVIDINENDINSTISPYSTESSQDVADSSTTSNFESARSSLHTSFSQNCTISTMNTSNSSQDLYLEPENVTISIVANLNGSNSSVTNQNNTNSSQNHTNSNQNHTNSNQNHTNSHQNNTNSNQNNTNVRENHTNSQIERNYRESQERRGSRSHSNTNTYPSKKAEALAAVR